MSVIRPVASDDAGTIAGIYNHYVLHTVITFEEQAVSAKEMNGRIGQAIADGMPWLVAELEGRILGFAYASKWKTRSAYRFSVETTVYLDLSAQGHGIGNRLYEELLGLLRKEGFHVVLACIALPNKASVALHEKFGLRQVALFEEAGFKFGRWVDVGYWQAKL